MNWLKYVPIIGQIFEAVERGQENRRLKLERQRLEAEAVLERAKKECK